MTEQEREDKLHAWFDMWLRQTDDGILELFVPDAVYVESWGPEYHGVDAIRHWFMEWNTRGRVLTWDIKQFFPWPGAPVPGRAGGVVLTAAHPI